MSSMRQVVSLLPGWIICTFIAASFGSEYVRSTYDCWTPATLTQAFGVILYLLRKQLVPSSTGSQLPEWPHLVLLGVLQLLSILLTLGSFGITSVSHTYILRTLEPVFSLVLVWFVWQRKSSFKELVLVCLVVGSIVCVVHSPTTASAKQAAVVSFKSMAQPANETWRGERCHA